MWQARPLPLYAKGAGTQTKVSQILVSCEMPIHWEQFCLVFIANNTCSIWYFIQFVSNAIFLSLHGPAGACIPVASESPIHECPVQPVLKHCDANKHIHSCDPKQS